jgi:NTP pyrophosphatase (non-canonical NTP hydrolase)
MTEEIATEMLLMNDYQRFTLKTDKNPQTGYAGLKFSLLGLFGEVGSLLSELKKKQHDRDSYVGYAESVMEELGDVMWYFANIAQRAGLNLDVLAQRMSREIEDWDMSHMILALSGTYSRAASTWAPLVAINSSRER